MKLPKLTRVVLGAAVASVASLTLVTPPANAVVGGDIRFSDGVLFSGCGDYDYAIDFYLPMGTSTWSGEVRVMKADGTEFTSDFISGRGRIGVVEFEMFMCGAEDAGTFVAEGEVTATSFDGFSAEVDLAPAQFTMRAPQTRTTASIPKNPSCGRTMTVSVRVDEERPAGFFPAEYGEAVLQRLVGKKWRTVPSSSGYIDYGRARLTMKLPKKQAQCQPFVLRAATLTDRDYHSGSSSSTVAVNPRPAKK